MDLKFGDLKKLLDISSKLHDIKSKINKLNEWNNRKHAYLCIIDALTKHLSALQSYDDFSFFMEIYEDCSNFIDYLENANLQDPSD
jgi:hypothetical protein